jgi:hypothetical protein
MVSGARPTAVARINPIVPAPVRMNACNDGACAAVRPAWAQAVAASLADRSPGQKRLALPSAPVAGFASRIVTLLGSPERQGRSGSGNWFASQQVQLSSRHFCAGTKRIASSRSVLPLKDAYMLSYADTKISMKRWVDNLLFAPDALLE